MRRASLSGWVETEDTVVCERPLTIMVNGEELTTVICTPQDLKFMVAGFLRSEGILREPGDLQEISFDLDRGIANVTAAIPEKNLVEEHSMKRYVTTCGGRGLTSLYFSGAAPPCRRVTAAVRVKADTVARLMQELHRNSLIFRKTGGVHDAALVEGERIIIFQEDVGRHNTLDKILGQCFLENIPTDNKLLFFSGRISSEVLLKVARMGVPVLVSCSAPTDLALQLAEELGITVVGFAREDNFNIYTYPERIIFSDEETVRGEGVSHEADN